MALDVDEVKRGGKVQGKCASICTGPVPQKGTAGALTKTVSFNKSLVCSCWGERVNLECSVEGCKEYTRKKHGLSHVHAVIIPAVYVGTFLMLKL